MNSRGFIFVLAVVSAAGIGGCKSQSAPETPQGSTATPPPAMNAADLEKEKALKNPFANDLGPDSLDVSRYPADQQKGYELLKVKCARCHSAARPLNSQFADSETWQRYVKRMMAKPGCEIASSDGKAIWEFLVYDSKVRKLDPSGKEKPQWAAHRKKLLEEFRQKYPARYQELYGTQQ